MREIKSRKTVLTSGEYWQWIGELKKRYRATQIKAAIAADLICVPWGHHLQAVRRLRSRAAACEGSAGVRTAYELKKLLPTQAQLAKCYADAVARLLTRSEALACIMGAGGAFAELSRS